MSPPSSASGRQLGLERLLQRTRSRRRDLALAAIVARVLQPGSKLATLLLYYVSSSYLEGRCSPLAAFGHNRDGKQQIVFGLLCAADGCPVAVDVFAGNTADPSTVGVQVKKVQQRFGLESIALVGDRGLLTTARLRDDLEPAGLAWISALKTDAIRKLLRRAPGGPRCGRASWRPTGSPSAAKKWISTSPSR